MIRALVESGNLVGAQVLILEELESRLGGIAEKEAAGFTGAVDTMGEAWSRFLERLGGTESVTSMTRATTAVIDFMTAIAAPSIEEEIAQLEKFQKVIDALGGDLGLDFLSFNDELHELRTKQADQTIKNALEKQKALAAETAKQKRLSQENLLELEADFDKKLLALRENNIDKLRALEKKDLIRLEALRVTGSNSAKVDELIAERKILTAKQITQARQGEIKAAERMVKANISVVDSLKFDQNQLQETSREQFINTQLRRLNEKATDDQTAAVRDHAAAVFDLKETQKAANKAAQQGRSLTESLFTPQEKYNAALAKSKLLLDQNEISQETFIRQQKALNKALTEAGDSVVRSLEFEREQLTLTDRERFISVQLRGLEADQVARLGPAIRRLAGRPCWRLSGFPLNQKPAANSLSIPNCAA